MTTLFVVEDYPLVRQLVKELLSSEDDFTVIGEAGDGLEARRLICEAEPDILVTDVGLPGLPGLELVRRVRQDAPATRIVVLSVHDEEAYVLGAFRSGASAYVQKDDGAAELVSAVRVVLAGGRYLSRRLLQSLPSPIPPELADTVQDFSDLLTPRPRRVLRTAGKKPAQRSSRPPVAAKS